jgi:hypothetical protein
MPFFQLGVSAVAEAHFSPGSTYKPPILSGDVGYFILWQMPVLICYASVIFIIFRFFIKKEKERSLLYILFFLTLSSIIMYMRTMVLGEPLKVIFSLHFIWFLLVILLFYLLRLFESKSIILYGLLLINFVPTLPLFSSKLLNDSKFFLQHNNFYITTLDAELKYLFKRNIDRRYWAEPLCL